MIIVRILLAAFAALGVAVGPHMAVMLTFASAVAVVLLLAQRIDSVTMRTGWRIIPVKRTAAYA